MKRTRLWAMLFTWLALVLTLLTPGLAFAEDHYIAVGSDRHSNTSAIANAMGGMPSSVEFVCLAGDMTTNQSYNTSTLQTEVQSGAGLSNATVAVIQDRHDTSANDDAGILFEDSYSGVMYTGYNTDGSVAFYAYVAAHDSLFNQSGNTVSNPNDAAAFESWVDNYCTDTSIPIIVIAHVPLHSQRNDNLGAAAWNKALNYAATGKETTSSGSEIIRNVMFLHGHNHTTESNREYYIPAGSTMKIGTSNESSYIYYTYTTAGYLNANNAASLIKIDDDDITVTKYKNKAVTSTYSSNVSFADNYDTAATHSIARVSASEEPSPTSSIYVLTDALTAGKDYLIVSRNSSGDGYALTHSSGTVGTDAVSVEAGTSASGNKVYIDSADVESSSVWTATASGSLLKLMNGSYYLQIQGSGNTLSAVTSETYPDSNTWSYSGSALKETYTGNGSSSRERWVSYSSRSGFGGSSSSATVYIYEKVSSSAAAALSSIAASGAKDSFAVGDSFSTEGLKVTASYSDGTTKDVTASASVDSSAVDTTKAGTYDVTVSYAEGGVTKTATYQVTVSASPEPSSGDIYVLTSTLTAGKEYLIVSRNSSGDGYALTHSSGTVGTDAVSVEAGTSASGNKVYIDSADVESSSVWTATASGSLLKLMNGSYYLQIQGSGNTLSAVTSETYPDSNTWSYSGSALKETYTGNNSSSRERWVSYSSRSGFGGSSSSATVYIYEKVSSSAAATLSSIAASGAKDSFAVGDSFSTEGLKVTASYSDGTTKDVTSSASVDSSAVDMTKAGTYDVTVSYAEDGVTTKTATYQVTVSASPEPSSGDIYVLTDALTAGKDYLIVSRNTASTSGHALSHSGTSAADDAVAVKSDTSVASAVYVESSDVESATVWTATTEDGLIKLKNGGYYLEVLGQNNTLTIGTSESSNYTDRQWTVSSGILTYTYKSTNGGSSTSTRTRYLRYNNSWSGTDRSSNSTAYLYEKVSSGAHEHTYGTPSYAWTQTDTGYSCTATMTCTSCAEGTDGHVVTETVSGAYSVTTAASCENKGSGTYTATFTNSAFATQTKTVEIDALGHDWDYSNITWNWTKTTNGYTATATLKCTRNNSHTTTVNATVTGPVDGVYTATIKDANNTSYTDTKKATYTITFVNDDNTQLQSGEVEHGELPTYDGATPTKPGDTQNEYSFTGWTPEVVVATANATYKATYSKNISKFTVTFQNYDGTVLQTSEVEQNVTPRYTGSDPTREADAQYTYTFTGWTPTIVPATANATYTATYSTTVKTYTITFVNDDDTQLQTGKVAYGTTPTYNGQTPTKAATAQYTYTFAGWTPTIAPVTGEATYKATYTSVTNAYTVTFSNGDVQLQSTDVPYGTPAVYVGATPTKAATAQYTYTFAGWSDGTTTYGANDNLPAVTGNIDYTAQFTSALNKYTVTFYDEDGTTVIKQPKSYDYGTAWSNVEKPAEPTKTGYTFAAWQGAPQTITSNVDVTASYTANTYKVAFNANGGTGRMSDQTLTYDKQQALTANDYTRVGCTFTGWNTKADGNGTTYADKEYVTNLTSQNGETVTLYAQWSVISYKIEYDLAGGSLAEGNTNPTTYTVSSGTITLNNPTKAGYTFAGWTGTNLSNATMQVTIAAGSTGDRTYTATWTENAYSVELNPNYEGGQKQTISDVAYTQAITLPNIARDGFTLASWNTKADGSGIAYSPDVEVSKLVDENGATLQLYAQWTTDAYVISYDLAGGKLEDGKTNPSSYNTTSDAITLNNPTKTGYTFAGWTGTGLNQATTSVTIPVGSTGNRSYTATWTINTYSVSYDLAGGTLADGANPTEYNVESGSITLTNPTKTGYTFAGWTGTGLTEPTTSVTIPTGSTENRSYTATWKANAYTVTFDANGGAGEMTGQTFAYDTAQKLTANAYTNEGFDFVGWATAKDGEVKYADGENVSNLTTEDGATITLYAVWSANGFTITWKNEDGTVLATTAANYGTIPAYPNDAPTKASTAQYTYQFAGWTPDIVAATKDATYTAQFDAIVNEYTVIFVDEDGTTVLKGAARYPYGTKAVDIIKPVDPTKEADDTYNYTFSGWTPELAEVTADVVYKATYRATEIGKTIWKRLDGANRYDTMASIVTEGFASSRVAVLATGQNFPDALVASSVAGLYNCPVVLTKSTTLSPQAQIQLVNLGVKKVYVMGGDSAVSDKVLELVNNLGIESERIMGSNRQATSLAALDAINRQGEYDGTVVIATGYNFADALSIGPWCYKTATPIILTNKNGKLTDDEVTALKKLGVSKLVIVGGTAVVSDDVVSQLGLKSSAVKRLSGNDRYETSLEIAKWETGEKGMVMTNTTVATGANFPDALAGAALCGKNNSVLLLATDSKRGALEPINGKAGIETGYVLGGTSAVSEELFSYLEDLVK